MGKAARWLKGLFSGGSREKKKKTDSGGDSKDKNGWSFARSIRDKEVGGRRGSQKEVALRGEDEQSKRAIAVAAATAAAAEAAVAAAQAAAAVVRLTSRGSVVGVTSGRRSEDLAAIKIQAYFRGYLARRALKALKGLVKLQALVRGYIVRKQAMETLRCMQALVRVQSRVREGRGPKDNLPANKGPKYQNPVPRTPEKYEHTIHVNGAEYMKPGTLRKNASKATNLDTIDPNSLQSSGWNWLDRWMEERYWDSRESLSRTGTVNDDEKILEIDAGKPYPNSKWRNIHHSVSSSLTSENIRSYVTVADSPSMDSTVAQHSVPSPSSVVMQQSFSPLAFPLEAEEFYESPGFFSASSRNGSSRRGSFTPSKSECSHSVFSGYSDHPSYMSNTESFKAKVRSHSAPRQRPEIDKSGSVKRSLVHGYGVGDLSCTSQRSSALHPKFTGKAYHGSGRLDRMSMPMRTS